MKDRALDAVLGYRGAQTGQVILRASRQPPHLHLTNMLHAPCGRFAACARACRCSCCVTLDVGKRAPCRQERSIIDVTRLLCDTAPVLSPSTPMAV